MTDRKAIFNLQRFSILQTKLNPQTAHFIPDEYAFAWYVKLYPFFNNSDLHEDLEECFTITKEQLDNVTEFLDTEWLAGKLYTFYELEKIGYGKGPFLGLDRMGLIYILKYVKLYGGFDEDFWNEILKPMKHPSEARSIQRPFGPDDIYLV